MDSVKHLTKHPSIEWRFIDDDNGMIMPWYTEPTLQWLKNRDFSNSHIFEYGAGTSSMWWRSVAEQVDSVDDNEKWAKVARSMFEDNKENYCRMPVAMIQTYNQPKYDYIVIDGAWRDDCTEHALKAIKKGGYLIIDNFHQPSADLPISAWPKTNDLLAHYPQVVFHQEGHPDWKTSVWQIIK